jgi:hypothetical protein
VFRSPMIPLRVIAIISNILFSPFGLWAHIYPVMLLHLFAAWQHCVAADASAL